MTDPRLQTKTGDLVCPACGNTVATKVKLIGQRYSCQKCGGNFLAPQTNPIAAMAILALLLFVGVMGLVTFYLIARAWALLP